MKFIRNMPVFYSLLGIGLFVLLLTINNSSSISKPQSVIAMIFGLLIGAIVSYIEFFVSKRKNIEEYHPTHIPIWVFLLIVILGLISKNIFKIWVSFLFGSYIVSLSVAVRIYEKRNEIKGITWNELMPTK